MAGPVRIRPVSDVPAAVVGILLIGMALQFIWHGIRPAPLAAARALPPAMEREVEFWPLVMMWCWLGP